MNRLRSRPILGVILLLASCRAAERPPALPDAPPAESVTPQEAWRQTAREPDVDRVENIEAAWYEALAEAQRAGFGRAIAAEGALLDPGAALPRPAPTPGSYLCRTIRLGRSQSVRSAFTAFKPFFCYIDVEDELLTIVKQTGSHRPAGRLWEIAGTNHLVFLGTLALGDEETTLPYGQDPSRDLGGVFERVAPFRYRLVLPWPPGGGRLDVIEFTPAPKQPEDPASSAGVLSGSIPYGLG